MNSDIIFNYKNILKYYLVKLENGKYATCQLDGNFVNVIMELNAIFEKIYELIPNKKYVRSINEVKYETFADNKHKLTIIMQCLRRQDIHTGINIYFNLKNIVAYIEHMEIIYEQNIANELITSLEELCV